MAAVHSLRYVRWACVAVAATLTIAESFAANNATPCKVEAGRVVSRQGTVEVRRQGVGEWLPAKLEMRLCDGDAVRTAPRSRAALFIRPENIVRLDQNTAISLRVTDDETIVDFFTNGQVAADPDCGAGYFISRFPRKFRVRTQHVSAEIDGTEFLVRAACEATTVAVYEGAVRTTELSTDRRVLLKALEQITVGPGYRDSIPIRIKPRDGVQWTIHYPRLSARPALSGSLQATCPSGESVCDIIRAEALLAAGRADDAHAVLQPMSNELNAEAMALESIVRIARDDRDGALEIAQAATKAAPDSPRAWTALSYARQAQLDQNGALAAAREAARLGLQGAVQLARVAELLLVLGETGAAREAASRAVGADPSEPRAQQMIGFTALARNRDTEAAAAFRRAMELDESDPATHLGLGLALIRANDVKQGREQIEIASALDPTNANVRSYLGRAYREERTEKRLALATEQLALAKRLDPNDPTPWLLAAEAEQARGRPPTALAEIEESVRLNDSRGVVRAPALLEEDRAARAAGLARTYRELGFSQLAIQEGALALSADPTNYAAHRLLADGYQGMPRQEIARVSELLQAQLRQPLTRTPISAQLAEYGFQVPIGLGPVTGGLTEFGGAFDRRGAAVEAYAVAGTRDSLTHQVAAGAAGESLAGAVTSYGFRTTGFRESADQNRSILSAVGQWSPSDRTSVQAGVTRFDGDDGDFVTRFDPRNYALFRQITQQDHYQLGFRHEESEGNETLGYAARQQVRGGLLFDTGDSLRIEEASSRIELQQNLRLGMLRLLGGVAYSEGTSTEDAFGLFFTTSKPRHSREYIYGFLPVPMLRSRLEFGVVHEKLRSRGLPDQEHTSPKLGLIWMPTDNTVVRASYVEGLKRRLISDQSLEPSHIAGFSQLSDDLNGTISRRKSAGVSLRPFDRVYFGAELSIRTLSVPAPTNSSDMVFVSANERERRAYLYWVPSDRLAASVDWYRDVSQRPEDLGGLGFLDLRQANVPMSLRVFGDHGLSASITARYISQTGRFFDTDTAGFVEGHNAAWLADAGLRWLLPSTRGYLALDALNFLDRRFRYQETDYQRSRFPLGRWIMLRLVLTFVQ